MTITFFGHKDTGDNIKYYLNSTLEELIKKENANVFYVGNHGNFDNIVISTLKKLKKTYPHITYYIVFAYMPKGTELNAKKDYETTIFPERAATAIPKFAINERNLWMIEKSDTVITYVTRKIGGAYKFKKTAKSKGKRIIELSEIVCKKTEN